MINQVTIDYYINEIMTDDQEMFKTKEDKIRYENNQKILEDRKRKFLEPKHKTYLNYVTESEEDYHGSEDELI